MQLSPNQLTLLHIKNIGKVNIQSCGIILKKTKLFCKYQFGFKKNHSTSHATSLLIKNIAEAFENKEHVLGIFLDLSKAGVAKLRRMFHNLYLAITGVANLWRIAP